jgi:DNA-directed RNA polymerase subunit RPC12/RpoP
MRYVTSYTYVCDDCGAEAVTDGDSEPQGWLCPEPDFDDSTDYCPACAPKHAE